MVNQNAFSILSDNLPGPLYTDGMDVWVIQPNTKTIGLVQKLGSFYDIVMKSYFREIVTEAIDYANRIHDVRFALCDLIPWLKFLDSGQGEPPSSELQKAVSDFTLRAMTLQQKINMPQCQQAIAPSIIIAGLVIKLTPIKDTQDDDLKINDVSYKFSLNTIRPIVEVLSEIHSIISLNEDSIREIEAFAGLFINDLESMIRYFFPAATNDRPYRVIYQGRHELQYSRGFFVLVRGPLTTRIENPQDKVPFYVGIPATGRTRAERIATVPCRVANLNDLWDINRKFTLKQPICMGDRQQYTRLSSTLLNDAEAVVQWLDAAISIATNVSQFHQNWRKLRINTVNQIRNRPVGR